MLRVFISLETAANDSKTTLLRAAKEALKAVIKAASEATTKQASVTLQVFDTPRQ